MLLRDSFIRRGIGQRETEAIHVISNIFQMSLNHENVNTRRGNRLTQAPLRYYHDQRF